MEMPYLLEDLVIDRVDLVDEGANSAAFIQLFKRKEMNDTMNLEELISKLKPEEAEIIKAELAKQADERAAVEAEKNALVHDLEVAKEDLKAASEDLESIKEELNSLKEEQEKAVASFDEENVIKSMPEEMREIYTKMRDQKLAAEEELRKAREAADEAAAIAKANELKSLPVDQEKLVAILKKKDEEIIEVLTTISAAIDTAVLGEIGKSNAGTAGATDAWSIIDSKADEIAKRDSITKQKAIAQVLKENPDLYKNYLEGGKK